MGKKQVEEYNDSQPNYWKKRIKFVSVVAIVFSSIIISSKLFLFDYNVIKINSDLSFLPLSFLNYHYEITFSILFIIIFIFIAGIQDKWDLSQFEITKSIENRTALIVFLFIINILFLIIITYSIMITGGSTTSIFSVLLLTAGSLSITIARTLLVKILFVLLCFAFFILSSFICFNIDIEPGSYYNRYYLIILALSIFISTFLTIKGTYDPFKPKDKNEGDLNIIKALFYYKEKDSYIGKYCDSTDKIKDEIEDNKIDTKLDLALMPKDPSFGDEKDFFIVYEYKNKTHYRQLKENDQLILP